MTTRTPEIGLRMALGADASRITTLVMRAGLLATSAGLLVGGLFAGFGLQLLRSEVFGLTDHQPIAYVGAAVMLLAVALGAMFLPARRAARLDPLRAIATK